MLDNWFVENWFIAAAVAIIYIVTSKIFAASSVKDTVPGEDQVGRQTTDGRNATPNADIVWQNIRHRRSIFPKNYLSEESVSEENIWKILKAANWAPTHGKTEPWRFVVIERSEIGKFLDVVALAMETIEPAEKREEKLAKLKKKGMERELVPFCTLNSICIFRK